VLLAVTGSIAAYKAVLLFRLLQKAGAELEVLLTEAGERFVGAATFRGLGAEVHTDMFSAPGELHVALGERTDAIVVAPATADTLARLRAGRGNDLLTATVLCSRADLVLVPAMHPRMWSAAAVQENVAALSGRGAHFVGPVEGEVASGDVGLGRMAEPEHVVTALVERSSLGRALLGRHFVVTAGPTSEPLDPVRALTNVSSGKMGFAIASEAARRGARVTLIAGPVSLTTPPGVTRLDVGTALQMRDALWQTLGEDLASADALVMSAAVADYRPKEVSPHKLKRDGDGRLLELVPNPDLLAEVGAARRLPNPLLVGFALETGTDDELIARGRQKLRDKRVDLVVANHAAESLGRDDNRVSFVSEEEHVALPRLTKPEVARRLVDWLAVRLTRLEGAPAGEGEP
jgi:phosphopantothenoylcysteine decarboxylase/phosphopantothenate--cysteine ligase